MWNRKRQFRQRGCNKARRCGGDDIDGVGDRSLMICRAFLADECSVHACVSHPPYQLASARLRHRGEMVAGMPHVMDVDTHEPGTIQGKRPHRLEVRT